MDWLIGLEFKFKMLKMVHVLNPSVFFILYTYLCRVCIYIFLPFHTSTVYLLGQSSKKAITDCLNTLIPTNFKIKSTIKSRTIRVLSVKAAEAFRNDFFCWNLKKGEKKTGKRENEEKEMGKGSESRTHKSYNFIFLCFRTWNFYL
jgi:hypothetical protein